MTHDYDKALDSLMLAACDGNIEHPGYAKDYETIRHALSMAKVTEEMAGALKFYADKNKTTNDLYFDGGCIARKALTAYEAAIKDRGME